MAARPQVGLESRGPNSSLSVPPLAAATMAAGAEAGHHRVLQTNPRKRVRGAQVLSPSSHPGAILVPASTSGTRSLGLTRPSHVDPFHPFLSLFWAFQSDDVSAGSQPAQGDYG